MGARVGRKTRHIERETRGRVIFIAARCGIGGWALATYMGRGPEHCEDSKPFILKLYYA